MAIDESCVAEAEARARADYAAPGRHYHDERHLDECLGKLEEVEDLGEQDRRLLRWAIVWHDVIYDPHRADNEERSAVRAERELRDCGIDATNAMEVARLILLTKGHRTQADDRLGALMVSIDLSILGAPAEAYDVHANAIREEYAHLPDDAWRRGRAAVLKSLLASEPIYPDPRFRADLEAQARRNMQAELKALSEG